MSTMAAAGASQLGPFAAAQAGLERLPLLHQALEQTGVACAEEVRGIAGVPLRLALQSIEPGMGEDLLAGDGDRAVAVLHASAWEARLLVRADRNAVFSIIEAMLGGDGTQPAHVDERALSGVEVEVAGLFFAALARGLAATFAPIAASPFSLEPTDDAVELEATVGKSAMVVAKYRVDAPGPVGEVLIAIPRSALAALRKPLSQAAKVEPQPDPGWTQHISKEITRANVTLTAILDERMGMLAEVFSLAEGQIIELEATPQTPVRVECNGEPMIWCELGKSNGVYTLRVEGFVDREQEFMKEILAA